MPKSYEGRTGPMLWEDFIAARREMLRYIAGVFTVLTLFVTWTLWQNEHDSCARSAYTRGTQREIIAKTGIVVDHPPRHLTCNKVLPDH